MDWRILKVELKEAASIRKLKDALSKPHTAKSSCELSLLHKLSSKYRHGHIAYCLIKGTPYECIEKPRQGNEPDMAQIKEIQDVYTTDVCAGAQGSR